MFIAACVKEGARKLKDAGVPIRVETKFGRLNSATFFVAALHLAVFSTVVADAVLVAVARLITGDASRSVQVRSIRLGSLNDGMSHSIDRLLDRNLLVELLVVLICGLFHEHTLGSLKRNIEGRNSISDLDTSISSSARGGLEVASDIHLGHTLVSILASLAVVLDVVLDVIELILEGVTNPSVYLSRGSTGKSRYQRGRLQYLYRS